MSDFDYLTELTPDPQAVAEVAQVHEQIDPPGTPLFLSAFANLQETAPIESSSYYGE